MGLDPRWESRTWLAVAPLLALAAAWLEHRTGSGPVRMAWRGLLVLLAGLALAGPRGQLAASARSFVLIDRSASVSALSRTAAEEALADVKPFLSLDFGDPEASPIGQAMADLRPTIAQGDRVLLLSDGLWSGPGPGAESPEPRSAAASLRAAGARVDVLPLEAQQQEGVALWAADPRPRGGREGDLVLLRLRVASDAAREARLRLSSAGRPLATQVLSLVAGVQDVELALGGLTAGAWRIDLLLETDAAGKAEAEIGVTVAQSPRVLVAGEGELPLRLSASLARAGLGADAASLAALPGTVSAYSAWDAVLLLDPSAERLGYDQLEALEAQVLEGGGLLLTAGPGSFDAGAWQGTALESLSPLELEPVPRGQRPAIALSLLVDRSASMGSVEGHGRLTKIDLARDAALLAAQALRPGDRMGLLAFDATAEWLLPPAVIGAGRERADLEAALAGLNTAGGTGIGVALDAALPELLPSAGRPAGHAVLITDGRDFGSDRLRLLGQVGSLRAAGATLSTIALGAEADRGLLATLAQAGGGRMHVASEPGDLPRIALAESRILSDGAERRGSFRAAPPSGPWHSVLAGIDVGALPPLQAYRSLRARAGLRPALELGGGDPLLVAWPRGRGQVAAFSSNPDETWAAGWLDSPAAIRLLAAALRQLARAPEATSPQLRLAGGPRDAYLVVSNLHPATAPSTTVQVEVEGRTRSLPALATGPGTLIAPLPPGMGPRWVGALRTPGQAVHPFVVIGDTVPERWPGQATDRQLLAEVARAGGGEILTASAAKATLLPHEEGSAWPWGQRLLAIVALLWLIDIAQLLAPGGLWLRAVGPRLGRRKVKA